MSESIKSVFRENLTRLMRENPDVDTRAKLVKRSYYLSGKKKGSQVGGRTIGYMFQIGDDEHSPSLAAIEAVAKALGVRPWELLIRMDADREDLMKRLFGPAKETTYQPDYARRDGRVVSRDPRKKHA